MKKWAAVLALTCAAHAYAVAQTDVGRTLLRPPVVSAAGLARAPAARSSLRIGVRRPGGGYTVTNVPLETYVSRVLAGEAARDSQPAALEALAIAVRTYTLFNAGRHRADGFDLCDETHCQVNRAATAATDRAANATAGQALLRDGVPASIYYSASCGGRTEIPSAVWPGAENPSYLPSQHDDACAGTPVWSADLSAADLLRSFRAGGFRGERLRDMKVAARNASGRVSRLRLEGLEPQDVSGQDLRAVVGRTLGWQHIKSATFELKREGDRYRFSGRGSGHGVGLCVIGSTRLAVDGRSASDILKRYFPGLAIGVPAGLGRATPLAPGTPAPRATPVPMALVPEVLVSLPDGDEGERAFITTLTARARTELSASLGVAPLRVTLRFHPDVASYEKATGRSWFTAGAMVDGDIHLLPPTVLRDRGVLDRTIRHELVHVLTNTALASRPEWVREGAAGYFAGSAAPADKDRAGNPARTSCPTDAELVQPVSVGALTNAQARAQACFVRELGRRKSWREVR